MNTLTVRFEHTDTFGGDANYSWVRLDVAQLPDAVTRRSLVQRGEYRMPEPAPPMSGAELETALG